MQHTRIHEAAVYADQLGQPEQLQQPQREVPQRKVTLTIQNKFTRANLETGSDIHGALVDDDGDGSPADDKRHPLPGKQRVAKGPLGESPTLGEKVIVHSVSDCLGSLSPAAYERELEVKLAAAAADLDAQRDYSAQLADRCQVAERRAAEAALALSKSIAEQDLLIKRYARQGAGAAAKAVSPLGAFNE